MALAIKGGDLTGLTVSDNVLEALTMAAAAGDIRLVKQLIDRWRAMPEPDPPKGDERRPMYWLHPALAAAAYYDRMEVVLYLLEQQFCFDGNVIESAINGRSLRLLDVFLSRGWNINKRGGFGEPVPLAHAVKANDEELIRWFLTHGADPNAESRYKAHTPLTYAAYSGSLDTIKLLFEHGGDVRRGSLLHAVAVGKAPGRFAVLDFLLDKGASIDALEFQDDARCFKCWSPRGLGTPLHAAVTVENRAMVAALLGNGANKDVKDTLGRTPMNLAKKWKRTGMVELLEDC